MRKEPLVYAKSAVPIQSAPSSGTEVMLRLAAGPGHFGGLRSTSTFAKSSSISP
jgi:hypothetical protein